MTCNVEEWKELIQLVTVCIVFTFCVCALAYQQIKSRNEP